MKTRTRLWIWPALGVVFLPCPAALAQGKPARPARPGATQNGAQTARRLKRKAQTEARFFANMEAVLGRKLTATQKQQLRQAFDTRRAAHKAVETKFHQRVGQILHLTPEQLRLKERQWRMLRGRQAGSKPGAKAAKPPKPANHRPPAKR